MASGERAARLSWTAALAVLLVLGGFGLIAWSFIGPSVSSRTSNWSKTQALEYQAASANLHSLSLQSARAAQQGKEASMESELAAAQAKFQVLRGQLESAMDRPRRVAWWLRVAGLALVATGGAALYFRPLTSEGGRP